MHSSTISSVLVAALSSTALAQSFKTVTTTQTTFTEKVVGQGVAAKTGHFWGTGAAHGTGRTHGTAPYVTGHAQHTSFVTPPGQSPSAKAVSEMTIYDIYDMDIHVTPEISIISANPTQTCFALACPTDVLRTSPAACGALTDTITITEGITEVLFASSTVVYGHGIGPAPTGTITRAVTAPSASALPTGGSNASWQTAGVAVSCSIAGTTAAVCTEKVSFGPGKWQTTATIGGSRMWKPCTAKITAGGSKLQHGSNGDLVDDSTSTSTGRLPPKPTTTHSQPSSDSKTTSSSSSSFSGMAGAAAAPAIGSLAAFFLAVAALV